MLEISHMFSLYKESASLQRQLRDIKDSLDSGKQRCELSELLDLGKNVQQLRIHIDDMKQLNLIIEEAKAYTDRCNTYIGEWDKVVVEGTAIEDEGKAREYINEIIKFRDDI